ncbi:sensor histidine kinase [Archangium gephyra]|uniref:sensor histidine kinase n=1 Tax=Archangium gephyra TaxID=48 RepID=UPI003B7F34A9
MLERTAALEHAVHARDEFLSVASHELKTPITSLQLYVQGMLRAQAKGTLTPEQLNARLNRVQVQCGRLERLINNLLDVSQAEAREPVLQRESFDMSELVADATERFAEELHTRGLPGHGGST